MNETNNLNIINNMFDTHKDRLYDLRNINIVDDVFNKEDQEEIYKLCINDKYYYRTKDNIQKLPTGLVTRHIHSENRDYICINIREEKEKKKDIYDYFNTKVNYILPKNFHFTRFSINFFGPEEYPQYHEDSNTNSDLSLLYYPGLPEHEYLDIDEGGETQFLDIKTNTIIGVLPIPNRMVVFPSIIKHCAKPYRSENRLSIATMLKECDFCKSIQSIQS